MPRWKVFRKLCVLNSFSSHLLLAVAERSCKGRHTTLMPGIFPAPRGTAAAAFCWSLGTARGVNSFSKSGQIFKWNWDRQQIKKNKFISDFFREFNWGMKSKIIVIAFNLWEVPIVLRPCIKLSEVSANQSGLIFYTSTQHSAHYFV